MNKLVCQNESCGKIFELPARKPRRSCCSVECTRQFDRKKLIANLSKQYRAVKNPQTGEWLRRTERLCPHCKTVFDWTANNARTCSPDCRQKAMLAKSLELAMAHRLGVPSKPKKKKISRPGLKLGDWVYGHLDEGINDPVELDEVQDLTELISID